MFGMAPAIIRWPAQRPPTPPSLTKAGGPARSGRGAPTRPRQRSGSLFSSEPRRLSVPGILGVIIAICPAASRHPGRLRKAPPVSSSATTTRRCWRMSISRTSPVADARRGVPHRGEHRQAAKRAAADIEGHSAAAKFSQPRRLSAGIGRRSAPIALWCRTTEGGSPQPGSAGLGVYQAGSLRSASRLSVNHAVQGCRPAHSTFRSSDVRVGYFPPNTPPVK